MKIGDIVIMPGESVPEGEQPGVAIVVGFPENEKRVNVVWLGEPAADSEPRDWLHVVGHVSQWFSVPDVMLAWCSEKE